MATTPFKVSGSNAQAEFSLNIYRGESMVLLGMNWRSGKPPEDFVGFGIEYQPPGATAFKNVYNRLAFPDSAGQTNPQSLPSLQSPIQKFRWVHFPPDAKVQGNYTYKVTPVFMDAQDQLRYGPAQQATINLGLETYPGEVNVAFTRGFVSSQAFVGKYQKDDHTLDEIIPAKAEDGLDFVPTHPKAAEALDWMGFEARNAILGVLDEALEQPDASVKVIAYDLNEIEVVERLEKFGERLQIIIDDSKDHKKTGSAENEAARRLAKTAGAANVKRQHMSNLQHNKVIVVRSKEFSAVVCGSTNFSWRAFFVQSNNAIVLKTKTAADVFAHAFEIYFYAKNSAAFGETPATAWTDLGVPSSDMQVTFSPHPSDGGVLEQIGEDVNTAESSVLFSLAFLYQTQGAMRDAIQRLEQDPHVFVYGMSDRKVGGLDMKNANGRFVITNPGYLHGSVPAPFSEEPSGVPGIRMHHKFLVVDWDKPSARVYMGSYNFSHPADFENGEHLLCIKDQRIATAYMVEALRLFDHYEYRSANDDAKAKHKPLQLMKPPRKTGEKPWWDRYWTDARRKRDRELFSK